MSGSINGRDSPGDKLTGLLTAPDESGLPTRSMALTLDWGLFYNPISSSSTAYDDMDESWNHGYLRCYHSFNPVHFREYENLL